MFPAKYNTMLIFELFEAKPAQKTVVILPGGFHPFHPGHLSLYTSAQKMFPGADVYYAATNDKANRPFDIADKARLAHIAGVPAGHFVQVKSPFGAEEITGRYDPETTRLVYAKSVKNSKNGPDPEGPFPAEPDPRTGQLPLVTRGARKGLPVSDRLQYYKKGQTMAPMSRHSYIAYLPTVEFPAGPSGITSATQIRSMWPKASPKQRAEIVGDLYPGNPKLAQQILDKYLSEDSNSPVAVDSTSPVGGVAEHIGKVKGGYRLYSHKGKNLGTFGSKAGAEKHEREVQYFKHKG